MSAVTETQPARKWAMPDTLVIIFFVAILTSLATWVVPVGMFDSQEVQYQVDGQTKTRKVVDPHSFRILTNEAGEAQYHPVKFFTTGDESPGLMNFPFEGLTSGSKFGTAVGIIMFMLVIGGAFGIVMRTGTIDNGILALIRHTKGNEVLFIPVLFILFSLGGAVFGMGEEAVAFAIIIAPLMVLMPAVAIWAVIPFQAEAMVSNINAGLLYVMAISSVGVYGVILAGWASNSKYAFLGAMRASAQMISYEIAMGFALVTVLMVTGSLNLSDIVNSQNRGFFAGHGINILSWNWLPLLPMFGVYFISGVAETNRHPFDVVEGESEIVAGHMIEYSGMAFALFFLAEYINMIVISALTATLFLGGWASPIDAPVLNWIPGFFWLLIKVFLLLSVFIWLRASFPRYRYDQIMRLGWKIFIPLTVGWLVVVAIWLVSPWNIWK